MISTWIAFLQAWIRRLLTLFDANKPYNDLPLLPPKAELETKPILRKAIAANKALAELKARGT
jgi:hypothetical protein